MELWDRFHNYVNKYEDLESGKWFLMTSPIPLLVVTLIYIFIIKVYLPSYMKNRPPFQMQNIVVFFNFIQVLLSIWLFYGLLPGGLKNMECEPNGSHSISRSLSIRTKAFTYYYHLSKYWDLLDTIFFILRKKNNQVTRLHVYHHGVMPFWTWVCVKYGPDGRLTFIAFLNSLVHIVMYTYYMLSCMGPKYRKYIWWKKYVTVIQLVQFVVVALHTLQSAICGCNLSLSLSFFSGIQSIIFFVLFYDFYQQVYKKLPFKQEIVGDGPKINFVNNKKLL